MTSEQFAYWLQGFAEMNAEPPTADQWQAIKDHLALVFNKVTPPYSPGIVKSGPNQWMQTVPGSGQLATQLSNGTRLTC